MTDRPPRPDAPLQIHRPCPKSWGELVGDEKKRFCSACSLHVHNAVQLTRDEARTLVAQTSSRVCMRFVLDPHGAPIFSDSAPRRPLGRLAHWALSAAAGVLAACHGSLTTPANSSAGAGGNPAPSDPSTACTTELLGDVAMPSPQLPERMGEATVTADPAPSPAPMAPQPPGGDD